MDNNTLMKFMQNANRAKKLIQMDVNGTLDNVVNECKKNGKIDYSETSTNNLTQNNTIHEQQNIDYSSVSNYQLQNNNSKLPKEIVESFAKNNIDTSMLGVDVGQSSILDQIDKLSNGALFENVEQNTQKNHTKCNVAETANKANGNIDYSMIKMIVEDCMKKYASSIKKTVLNESRNVSEGNNLSAMKIGDKFSFIDNKGNLYEAKLTFVKNINEKKRTS